MNRVFIVAEAGSNWAVEGESKFAGRARAFELVHAAAIAGADAVKFQLFAPDGLYVPAAGAADYLQGTRAINDIIAACALAQEWLPGLAAEAEKYRIEFMCSVFEPEHVPLIDRFVKRHKVASYELGHEALIRAVAATGKPVILSTGAATMPEVNAAFWWVKGECAKHSRKFDLTFLHCTASYPAPIDTLNLSAITAMRRTHEFEGVAGKSAVGFSDHSLHPSTAPVAAVALGACVIEKHLTLDRRLSGPDHAFAILPDELKEMVQAVRAAEDARGDGQKKPQDCDEELRQFAVRSVQTTRRVQAGECFIPGENVAALRPGKRSRGVHARFLNAIRGHEASRDIEAWEGVTADAVRGIDQRIFR